LDATDSIENRGNSLTRPFKTIQRALIESARFSYQKGLDNDRFGKTTILLYPGEHVVDNRPGYIPDGTNNFILRNGQTTDDLAPFDLTTNFDLESSANALFKLNSVHGGVIIPRGTSLVGLDLRKTKIRPKYVPNPENDNIERTSVFRVTGGCYFWQFSIFDANPNGKCFVDYTINEFVPNFSHHKLTCFEYADGVNDVDINDTFLTYSTDRTDLDMYYEKVSIVYGQSSGRAIEPDYPSTALDIQPKIDEFRIVGSTGKSVEISSIIAGDGVTSSTQITATLADSTFTGLDVDTPFRVSNVSVDEYNGKFVVAERPSNDKVVYNVQNAPAAATAGTAGGAKITLSSDTVTSASPYIFNVSLRSVFGMCGCLTDGKKATGFRSMVIAQFTGIGLQKDDNAFVIYDKSDGQYDDNTTPGNTNLSTNSRAIYKPAYRNFHLKVTNDSVVQAVSVFAIGYAEHFVVENGGDISLTNSNSNFGAVALSADGFKNNAFNQDDKGYITHIIPPKQVSLSESSVEFEAIDVSVTGVGIGSTAHLYLFDKKNQDVPPENVLEGYRVGAKPDDNLKVLLPTDGVTTEYSARIVMPGSSSSFEKSFDVSRSNTGINSISDFSLGQESNVITLSSAHTFLQGESVRLFSETGQLPDGIEPNTVYFAITTGVGISTNRNIKLAKTLNDAIDDNSLTINDKGGRLKIVSRVSDKTSGDIGHPIQYDPTNAQWFIKVADDNTIFTRIEQVGVAGLGNATPRTFITRKTDDRNALDTIYRARYVIPSSLGGAVAKPPSDGFIIQESSDTTGETNTEIQTYFGTGSLANENEQRNFRFIANAEHNGNEATITTELPHDLSVGSSVELINIKSSDNLTGIGNSGFNNNYVVSSVASAKQFTVGLSTNPGSFVAGQINTRTTSLPHYKRKTFDDTYFIYRHEESQEYVTGEQDGVYYLTLLNASNRPTVEPFTEENYSQPIKDLYPQTNRDNPESDPKSTNSFARGQLIGDVVVDDVQNSVTRETLDKYLKDDGVGIGLTNLVSIGSTEQKIFTSVEHGLNRITKLSIVSGGSNYGDGSGSGGDFYNAKLVAIGASVTGEGATAKITIDSSGTITNVTLMDGGSAYGIGNTLSVTGVASTTGHVAGVVKVDSIYDNTGDVVRISGISSDAYSPYNELYRITDVRVGFAKSVDVTAATEISTSPVSSTSGIGNIVTQNSYIYQTGTAITISSLSYNATTGVGIVTTTSNHGLRIDNKVRFVDFAGNASIYNGSFVVTENRSLTSFSVNIGVGLTSFAASQGRVYREGYASNQGIITPENESLNGRMVPTYDGTTTQLSADVVNQTIDEISISNISNLNILIGDYLTIDDEIVRVKTTTTGSNPLKVFRSVLGTKAGIHPVGSVVRKIHVNPIELRRHSIIRASGHTFEYVGFGPGNYSTAFPDRQDRDISPKEELLTQSKRRKGGVNFYTGMNDQGVSYTGNKKLSSVTGQEEIFDTPIQTITGDDIGNRSDLNIVNATEGAFSRSIKIEGGSDNKASSEFSGPIIFNNKVTSFSEKGIEAQSFFIQGDQTISRKHTLSATQPTLAGNPGDIIYASDPTDGGYLGWVYTQGNAWRRFGNVSLTIDSDSYTFDKVAIGSTTAGDNTLQVGAGTTRLSVSGVGVTVGSALTVSIGGDAAFYGRIQVGGSNGTAGQLLKSTGTGVAWVNPGVANGWERTAADNGIYNSALDFVGIGNSNLEMNFEVGVSAASTMRVKSSAQFVGLVTANDVTIHGQLTSTGGINLQDSSGEITIGIVTTTDLKIGSGSTILATSTGGVGIGTLSARANLDVEGHTRFKSYSENVEAAIISGGIAAVDLSAAQSFTLNLTENVNTLRIDPSAEIPDDASMFTIKIQQSSVPKTMNLGNIQIGTGSTCIVKWPGGVIPVVSNAANATDIYSFKIFDGAGLKADAATGIVYGIVGGQNFS